MTVRGAAAEPGQTAGALGVRVEVIGAGAVRRGAAAVTGLVDLAEAALAEAAILARQGRHEAAIGAAEPVLGLSGDQHAATGRARCRCPP